MPELPEVETVMRGLAKAMEGHRIRSVAIARENLRIPFPANLQSLKGRRIGKFHRRAKYILMQAGGDTLILHLGMSGRMTINPAKKARHDHMTIMLDDGTAVVFNDPRRFGLVDLCPTSELERHRFFNHLGPEPLEKTFSADYLAKKLKGKKVQVKVALMDQRIVVGVGNIYASEALFDAAISPLRLSATLKKPEIEKLVAAVRKVLKKAIAAGGSSLRDYVQADGELGYFQHHWAVYDKEGKKCPRCKKANIARVTQGGRSTFYCPRCQK